MSKEQYHKNCEIAYDIYNIPAKDRGTTHNIHHLRFRSDFRKYPEYCIGYRVDDVENLCPMLKKDHDELHKRISAEMPHTRRKRRH